MRGPHAFTPLRFWATLLARVLQLRELRDRCFRKRSHTACGHVSPFLGHILNLTHSSVVARLAIAEMHDVVPGVVVCIDVARVVPFSGTRKKSLREKRARACMCGLSVGNGALIIVAVAGGLKIIDWVGGGFSAGYLAIRPCLQVRSTRREFIASESACGLKCWNHAWPVG